jgi:acetoin utilization protein AcuB
MEYPMKNHIDQIMTKKLITVNITDSVRKAYQLMQECHIRHLLVLDEDETIVGILSDRDLQRAIKPQKNSLDEPVIEFDSKFLARDFMSWPVQTIAVDTPLYEAVQLMLSQKISAFLAVDANDIPQGIITTDDFLRVLLSILEKDPPRKRLDLSSLFDDYFPTNYTVV